MVISKLVSKALVLVVFLFQSFAYGNGLPSDSRPLDQEDAEICLSLVQDADSDFDKGLYFSDLARDLYREAKRELNRARDVKACELLALAKADLLDGAAFFSSSAEMYEDALNHCDLQSGFYANEMMLSAQRFRSNLIKTTIEIKKLSEAKCEI